MRKFVFISFLFLCGPWTFGQSQSFSLQEGEVSFLTSQNVYVKFGNTEGIEVGDTLWVNDGGGFQKPCLIAQSKSSRSVVCGRLPDCDPPKGEKIFARIKKIEKREKATPQTRIVEKEPEIEDDSEEEVAEGEHRQSIKGRISAATYSNFDRQNSIQRHRYISRLSLQAHRINNSDFSFETYMNYRHNTVDRGEGSVENSDFFNVFNFALTYEKDSSFAVSLGRKINRKMASIGPVDGLQAEKQFSSLFLGTVAGFRPNLRSFGLSTKQFQAGLYAGTHIAAKNYKGLVTLGFIEQMLSGATDRRYLFLQSNGNIGRKLNVFASSELDLFMLRQGIESLEPRLTNFYLSMRYRINRKWNIMASYDSRKRVIYYQTYASEIERFLDEDFARQGWRLRLGFSPVRNLTGGLSVATRFQSNGQNKSNNINGYLSYARLPWIGGRISLNVNFNESNYLRGKVYSVRYAHALWKSKIDYNLYFRMADFQYIGSLAGNQTTYSGVDVSFRVFRRMRLSLLGEYSTNGQRDYLRMNTKLIHRF